MSGFVQFLTQFDPVYQQLAVQLILPFLFLIVVYSYITVIALSTSNRGHNFGQKENENHGHKLPGKSNDRRHVCYHHIIDRRPLRPTDYQIVSLQRCLGQNHVMTHATDNQGCVCRVCTRLLCRDNECMCRAPLYY